MVAIDNVLARKITKLMSVRSEKTEKMQEIALYCLHDGSE